MDGFGVVVTALRLTSALLIMYGVARWVQAERKGEDLPEEARKAIPLGILIYFILEALSL